MNSEKIVNNNLENKNLKEKQKLTKIIKNKYNKIPIILLKGKKSNYTIKKNKFLIPNKYLVNNLTHYILEKVEKRKDISLFLFINNKVLKGDLSLKELYNKYKNDDNFLYITYQDIETFGNKN